MSTSLHLMAFLNFQGYNVVVFSLRRDKLAMNRPHRNTFVFMRTPAHSLSSLIGPIQIMLTVLNYRLYYGINLFKISFSTIYQIIYFNKFLG